MLKLVGRESVYLRNGCSEGGEGKELLHVWLRSWLVVMLEVRLRFRMFDGCGENSTLW